MVWYRFLLVNATIKSRLMAYGTFTTRIALVSPLLRPFWGQGHGLIFMVFDGSFTRNINDLIIDFECRGKSPLSRFMCQLLQSFSSSLHNWIKKSSQVEGKKSL